MDILRILCCVLLGSIAAVCVRQLVCLLIKRYSRALQTWILLHLIYPRVVSRPMIMNPTRWILLLHLLYMGLIGFFNTYSINTLSEAGVRAGSIAIVHLIPLLAAPNLHLSAQLLGCTLATSYQLHRMLGAVAAAEGLFHSAIHYRELSTTTALGTMTLASSIALGLLVLVPIVRRYAYEIFLRTHFALSALLGTGLCLHTWRAGNLYRVLLSIAFGGFLSSLLYRLITQVCRNTSLSTFTPIRIATVSRFERSAILQLRLPRAWKIEPGQHIQLTLVTLRALSILQRHPFVITWWDSDPGSTLSHSIHVMIDPQAGWTRRVVNHLPLLQDQMVWLDGPYGCALDLHYKGCVLLFASGSGMFAVLPFVKRLTELAQDSTAITRRIKLVWYTDSPDTITQLHSWMQSLLDGSVTDKALLSITIHTTFESEHTREGERLCLVHDAPNVYRYLQAELSQPRQALAVVVSAFPELRESVRVELLRTKKRNVRLYELDYQPRQAFHYHSGSAAI